MQNQELLYVLALKYADGLGDKSIQKLVQHMGSAQQVFEANTKQLMKIPEVRSQALKNIDHKNHLALAQQELELIEKNKVKVLAWRDKAYPARLKQIPDNPCLLFYKGEIEPQPSRIISIVGTRKITSYGRGFLNELFQDIAKYQPVVVSGLAYGVDIKAHELALEHQLPTYGVLAHGLYRIYPSEHKAMARQIVERQGALITECDYNAIADKENFPKRNRIIAGLSDVTLVIESAIRGGSMITARLANDYHRDVMALPGSVNSSTSAGCNYLIKNNIAHMITEGNDLVVLMNWENEAAKPIQKQLFMDFTKEEQQLVDMFQQDGTLTMNQISGHLQLPTSVISVRLLGLEMKGVIVSLPGSSYKLS